MAKKELEIYEGMPVIEASDKSALKKKLEKIENPPAPPYAVRISNRTTAIKGKAFENCCDIAVVLIPDSVEVIAERAFYDCEQLAKVEIADSVVKIRDWAFYGCKKLTSIVIPDSVTEIGECAFSSCSGVKSIIIGTMATNIKSFPKLNNLQTIVVKEGNPKYDSRNGCNAIIETESNKLLRGSSNTIIPDSVTKIESSAFADCTGLTSIVIPDSVTKIGEYVFRGCTGLTSIVIPNSVTEIGYRAFEGCTGLTSIVIPDSVTEIGSCAFEGCSGLTSIVIGNSVTKIYADAFKDCIGLTNITIPDSVTEISYCGNCPNLQSIVVAEGNKNYDSRNGCNAIIETESNKLLYGCANTIIPDSVTEIGKDAFGGCTGLTSIVIPDSVTKIGKDAFAGCTGLTSIVIPNSVTEIRDSVFSGCSGLTSIVIPDSVTEIENFAFKDCTGLTSVVIPDSVTEIGKCAFDGCTGLTSIVIPDSVKKIGGWAFNGCTSLSRVEIPKSVLYDKSNSFPSETQVVTVKSKKEKPKADKIQITVNTPKIWREGDNKYYFVWLSDDNDIEIFFGGKKYSINDFPSKGNKKRVKLDDVFECPPEIYKFEATFPKEIEIDSIELYTLSEADWSCANRIYVNGKMVELEKIEGGDW